MTSMLSIILLTAAFAQGCVASSLADDAATDPPAANAPAKVEEPAPQEDAAALPAVDPAVDELLTRLETAAFELRDFSASLRYDKWDPVTMRWEIRAGDLLYEVKPDKSKRFAMLFDTLITGNRKQERQTDYIYDDGWLVERDHERKQFIKRQIVAPGKEFDPFKLGEGPFPLPVGQARDEVLARFDVSLVEVPEEEQLSGLENVQGLRLIPKEGAPEAADIERVDVFYDKASLLPVGISVIEADPSPEDEFDGRVKKIVRLRELKHNKGIDASKLDIREPDPNEWTIAIEPWRGEE